LNRTPPGASRGWAPPGANRIAGANSPINNGNPFNNPRDNFLANGGRGAGDFAGGLQGLSSAADAVRQQDFARGAPAAADAFRQQDFARGAASAVDALRQYDGGQGLSKAEDVVDKWWNREYARDLLSSWSWGSGDGGSGWGSSYGTSDSGYGSYSGYGTSDSGYGSAYSTATGGVYDSTGVASEAPVDSAQTSASSNEVGENAGDETAVAKEYMDAALVAFQNGDYAGAQRNSERAIGLVPRNTNLHEFRALCQFADGNYKDAAATLYKVLAAGPGWNWNALSSLYADPQVYTRQLRALEQFVKDHPSDASGRFVLAYHYLVLDHRGQALDQLRQVAKLQPQNKVSAGIVKALENAGKPESAADKPDPAR
jgi:tetratricopeptide (TPR) repeat protein